MFLGEEEKHETFGRGLVGRGVALAQPVSDFYQYLADLRHPSCLLYTSDAADEEEV